MGAFRASATGAAAAGTLLAAALLPACAGAPEYDGPPFDVAMEQYAGTVLSGPLPSEVDAMAEPWVLVLRLARVDAFEPPADEEGEALAARVQYVFAQPSAEPLKPRSELATGVRVYSGDTQLGEVVYEEVSFEALWPGSAVYFEALPVPEAPQSTAVPWDGFGWRISRPLEQPGALEVALTFDGWVLAPEDEQELTLDEDAEPERVRQREILVFSGQRLLAGERLRMVLEAPRRGKPRAAEILEAQLLRDPDPDAPLILEAVKRGRGRLSLAQRRARDNAAAPPPETGWEAGRARALEKLAADPLDRGSMLYLARTGDAQPVIDLVLVAAEEEILDFTAFLVEAARERRSDPRLQQPSAFGWFLEHQAYLWLADRADDPQRGLPVELESLMLRHLGELGRYPDLVVETLRPDDGRAAVEARIVHENRIFLADAHPAARVRAYDWLDLRGLAPDGYDPLAPRARRRAALEAFEALEPETRP